MTQTNTTQNKEELTVKNILTDFAVHVSNCHKRGVEPNVNPWADLLATKKELSQAHQSGIEEERKRIAQLMYDLEEPESPDIDCDDPNCGCNNGDFEPVDYDKNAIRNEARFEIAESLKENKQ